jgi:hypothetical protein
LMACISASGLSENRPPHIAWPPFGGAGDLGAPEESFVI